MENKENLKLHTTQPQMPKLNVRLSVERGGRDERRAGLVKNVLAALLLIGSVGLFFLMVRYAFGDDIWYDEVFSVVYAQGSFRDIVYLTASDVHPPFYYFYLKAVTELLTAFVPSLSVIAAGKLASLLPYLGLLALAMTGIRKRFGFFTASFFLFLVTVMPQLCNYYVEIRMYSLALLLITYTFWCAVKIISGLSFEREKRHTAWSFAGLFVCGILTAYTQYFACVAIIAIYLFLGAELLRRRGRRIFYMYGASILLSVLCYLPWLPKLREQLAAVSGSTYWIQPLSLRSLFGVVKFLYLPVLSGGPRDYVPAALMLLSTGMIVIAYFAYQHRMNITPSANAEVSGSDEDSASQSTAPQNDKEDYTGFAIACGPFVFAFMLLIGFLFSAAGHPILVYRYLLPAVGIWYLGFAYMTERVITPLLTAGAARKAGPLLSDVGLYLLLVPFLIGAVFTMKGFANEEGKKLAQTPETLAALQSIEDDSIILTNFDQVAALTDFYFGSYLKKPVKIYLYEAETTPAVQLMFHTDGQMLTREELVALISGRNADLPADSAGQQADSAGQMTDGAEQTANSSGQTADSAPGKTAPTIYFFGSFNAREELLSDWQTLGITSTEEGSYLLERYWFNIYRLEP